MIQDEGNFALVFEDIEENLEIYIYQKSLKKIE